MKEITRPFGGDCLQCFDGAQVVVGMPERERSMQSALPRIHRQRFERMEMNGGLRARVVSLAVEPEGGSVQSNDRRLGPAPCRIENVLDTPVEA